VLLPVGSIPPCPPPSAAAEESTAATENTPQLQTNLCITIPHNTRKEKENMTITALLNKHQ
jgi:hypothetical protein